MQIEFNKTGLVSELEDTKQKATKNKGKNIDFTKSIEFIKHLLCLEDKKENKVFLNDIFIKDAKFKIKGSFYNPADFTHVSCLSNLFLNEKLQQELTKEVEISSFKSNPEATKQKFNHKFNLS